MPGFALVQLSPGSISEIDVLATTEYILGLSVSCSVLSNSIETVRLSKLKIEVSLKHLLLIMC